MHYLDLTLKEIHQALLDKKVTPLELTLEAIKRAKDSKDNAFECLLENEAIEKAKSLLEPTDSLFWGIPYVAKDNLSTKGIETCASSDILEGYYPLFDATVIEKLNNEGAILIGKTTLDELAMGGSGTTGHKGITYNPYDPSHTHLMGGSSAGSATAVCGGIVPFALGSDTGDSIRKPASHGGMVGFKPTYGRISRYGLFSFAASLDHVGYFTRSVYDATALLTFLAGHDEKDMSSSFKDVEIYENYLDKDYTGTKVAVVNQVIASIKNKTILDAFNNLINKLKAKGVQVDYVDINNDILKAIFPAYLIISCAEATSNNACLDGIKYGNRKDGSSFQEVMMNTRTQGFGELIKRRFVIGQYSLLKENQKDTFLRAQKVRRLVVDKFNEVFANYDLILMPSAPTSAPKIEGDMDRLSDEYMIADNYMAYGNFGGYPSITLPLGFEGDLPFGVNLTGRVFEDGKVLGFAKVIEDLLPYYNLSVLTKEDKR